LGDGTVRALRVDVDEIAERAITLHGLSGDAARLCTEGIACAALLSAYLDEDERLTMQLQASEPRFALTVDVTFDGGVRARFTPSAVGRVVQVRGVMLVLKSVVGREVYRGASEIEHEALADVLQHHLDRSSQVPARVALRGSVGAFVERLPGSEASSHEHDVDLDALAAEVLEGLEGRSEDLRWECSCSEDRVLDMLASLGADEIRSMIADDAGAVVTCNFCTRRVEIGVEALQSLL
jgi:molecular chaperone Hsp33